MNCSSSVASMATSESCRSSRAARDSKPAACDSRCDSIGASWPNPSSARISAGSFGSSSAIGLTTSTRSISSRSLLRSSSSCSADPGKPVSTKPLGGTRRGSDSGMTGSPSSSSSYSGAAGPASPSSASSGGSLAANSSRTRLASAMSSCCFCRMAVFFAMPSASPTRRASVSAPSGAPARRAAFSATSSLGAPGSSSSSSGAGVRGRSWPPSPSTSCGGSGGWSLALSCTALCTSAATSTTSKPYRSDTRAASSGTRKPIGLSNT
mmetsp:Transcript_75961/g.215226  ORF Transcript_75961/g.215226 Transcript_75961/m.215226 type:complete len:266 (-) Transcript_75961:998-1795(-)